MAIERPHAPPLRYARLDEAPPLEPLGRALELARQIEELLEDTRSLLNVPSESNTVPVAASSQGYARAVSTSSHSTRMARAMAASLVDELEALVRPSLGAAAGSRRS